MKRATQSDKEKVIKIICEAFDKNPHINAIIKNDKKRIKRMAALAEYAFEFGLRRNGVCLTDDSLGVVIIFQNNKMKMNLYEYWLQLCLIFKSFALSRAFWVSKLESLIKKNRASNTDFLYLWFLGVANDRLGSNNARELMKYAFRLSHDKNLPIYAETSLKRNNVIFKRFGFEDYNKLKTGYSDLTMWFMKRLANHLIFA